MVRPERRMVACHIAGIINATRRIAKSNPGIFDIVYTTQPGTKGAAR